MTSPPLDDPNWLKWYNQLQNDRVRRKMGLNRPDEGVMDSSDRLQLMIDRGEGPQETFDLDSVRKRMGLPPLTDQETRKQMGLRE
ncbi:MAG: hypothetical protein ABSF09_11495 [Candidatus Bathyarchaeia archaeon]|jgi:hypothetical protein